MSDDKQTQDPRNELDTLKARADKMGITYSPRIGVEKLKAKINEHLNDDKPETKPTEEPMTPTTQAAAPEAPPVHIPSFEEVPPRRVEADHKPDPNNRSTARRNALRLVRIRVQCLNPAKKEWPGEVYTVSNDVIGTVKKFVPFSSEEGYHVPQVILDHMQERKCQVFYNEKTSRGNTIRKGKLVKELAIEVLPDLTPAELHNLAQRQEMAKAQV